jgi:hypothetical protein
MKRRPNIPLRLGEDDYGGTMVLDARGMPFAYVYSHHDAHLVVKLVNAWDERPAMQPPRVTVSIPVCSTHGAGCVMNAATCRPANPPSRAKRRARAPQR